MSSSIPAWARTSDPATVVEDALLLLDSGRTGMARTILEPLPGMIREAAQAIPRVNAHAARVTTSFEVQLASVQADAARLQGEARVAKADVAKAHAEEQELNAEIRRERRILDDIKASIARCRRELMALRPRPDSDARPPKPHERLAAALVSGRITPEAAAEVLKVRPEAVERLAQGRSTIAATSWARLWRAIEGGASA